LRKKRKRAKKKSVHYFVFDPKRGVSSNRSAPFYLWAGIADFLTGEIRTKFIVILRKMGFWGAVEGTNSFEFLVFSFELGLRFFTSLCSVQNNSEMDSDLRRKDRGGLNLRFSRLAIYS
jgi:hypothetical protein